MRRKRTDTYAALAEAFELLSRFPGISRERHELTPPVRVHAHGAHVIIYLVEDGDVLIVRIRHGREDWIDDPIGPE